MGSGPLVAVVVVVAVGIVGCWGYFLLGNSEMKYLKRELFSGLDKILTNICVACYEWFSLQTEILILKS